MKAVILCGGLGTRLRPITYEIPKVLLPLHGKPIIEHLFDLFQREKITDITLTVGYLKEKIMAHCGNGEKFGLHISYIQEDTPLGTAGALKLIPNLSRPFIVSNGDELKNIALQEMIRKHNENHALGTLALKTVENPSAYGVVKLNGERIVDFFEKPKNPPSNLISAGLYTLDPKIVELIPNGFSMLEKDIFPKLAERQQLFGFPFPGQWFDTGTFERYEEAWKNWADFPKTK